MLNKKTDKHERILIILRRSFRQKCRDRAEAEDISFCELVRRALKNYVGKINKA
jgi:hypothetical protein